MVEKIAVKNVYNYRIMTERKNPQIQWKITNWTKKTHLFGKPFLGHTVLIHVIKVVGTTSCVTA